MLICLRIIIELHKQFRPPISQEVSLGSEVILYTVRYIFILVFVKSGCFRTLLTDSSFSGFCEANLQRSA